MPRELNAFYIDTDEGDYFIINFPASIKIGYMF